MFNIFSDAPVRLVNSAYSQSEITTASPSENRQELFVIEIPPFEGYTSLDIVARQEDAYCVAKIGVPCKLLFCAYVTNAFPLISSSS